MSYKLLISDLDDTLTPNLGMPPREFIPSQKIITTFKKAVNKIHISFCTGRDKDTVIKICSKLGLKSPQIIEGGSKIIDIHGKILWVKYISLASIKKIFAVLKKINASFSIIVDGIEIMNAIPNTNSDKITAVLLYDLSESQTDIIRRRLSSHQDIFLTVNKDRKGRTIYITNKLGTKAHGVRKLINILNVEKKEVIGVGDGNNDKPLFLECGLKVAMGNADRELKKETDIIAPTVKEDGVAWVIQKYILNLSS